MKMENKKIAEILLKGSYITQNDFKKLEPLLKSEGADILDFLISENILTNDLYGQAIAEFFALDYGDLNSHMPELEQILKIPEDIARTNRIVLFSEGDNLNVVATDDPTQKGLKEAIKKTFPAKNIKLVYSLTEDINTALTYYKKALSTRFAQIIEKQKKVAPEIITEIIKDALFYKASDIHFEPQEKIVVIRFRVDGVLYEAGKISKEYFDNILNRIKVQAHMRIDEHQSAQDGAIRLDTSDGHVDMRVSIIPVLDGEKIVIRLLSSYVRRFNLGDLGFSSHDQEILTKAGNKPFGMILVVGPTGSGKSTTLYALLKYINKPDVNITTIEDPVEYRLLGINQIQVNQQTNLTFAKGLRSIVRQDPDIILVGEIRDNETAEIAVNASLTGHLLLSTFHANDAATTVPRLLDMGIEPFLLASTLELIIAQRLVRRICDNCKMSYSENKASLVKLYPSLENYLKEEKYNLYKGKGCSICNNSGFKGRTAIFEFVENTLAMQDLIMKSSAKLDIWALARSQGTRSMFEDGLEKALNGVTSIDEVMRVAEPPKEYAPK